MKPGEISITFPAEKTDLAKYLRFISLLGKTAITVLHIMGGENHSISDFKKIPVVAAIGADNAVGAFFSFRAFFYSCFMN